jgi:hypothetical protein
MRRWQQLMGQRTKPTLKTSLMMLVVRRPLVLLVLLLLLLLLVLAARCLMETA